MNNFEFTQKIRDELPNQIRRDIEEVKIATKKIIKNNSKNLRDATKYTTLTQFI